MLQIKMKHWCYDHTSSAGLANLDILKEGMLLFYQSTTREPFDCFL